MSFYVGPERFGPSQRDAQWRTRCDREVGAAATKVGGAAGGSRSRNPILGTDEAGGEWGSGSAAAATTSSAALAEAAADPGEATLRSPVRTPLKVAAVKVVAPAKGRAVAKARGPKRGPQGLGAGAEGGALSGGGQGQGLGAGPEAGRPGSGRPGSEAGSVASVTSSARRWGAGGTPATDTSQRSSVLMDALHDETRRRVDAEKELERLRGLLAESGAKAG